MKDFLVKPCPFCGAEVEEHPNSNTRKEFFIIYHNNGCFYLKDNPSNYTLLSKLSQKSWNKRI